MESEIFGHVKGAFTGQLPNTKVRLRKLMAVLYLLDEIREMDLELQSKLLRFTQTGNFQNFTPDAEAILLRYDSPGSVRELQNLIRNIVVLNNVKQVTWLVCYRHI